MNDESQAKKVSVPTMTLSVVRDALTILPVTVPAHEHEALCAVHGEENVQIVAEGGEAVEIEADAEVERLKAKYGPEMLEKAYGANFSTKIVRAVAAYAEPAGKAKTKG